MGMLYRPSATARASAALATSARPWTRRSSMLCWCDPTLSDNSDQPHVCAKDVGMLIFLAESAMLC